MTTSKKYWHKIYIDECPICGGGQTYRERQYTPKPDDPAERYSYNDRAYDWCMEMGAIGF